MKKPKKTTAEPLDRIGESALKREAKVKELVRAGKNAQEIANLLERGYLDGTK